MAKFVYNLAVDNVNVALNRGLALLSASGIREETRNGDVISMEGPVLTIYENPTRRVLFNTVRNANPFFHLFEALWMLAGRNDLPWLAQFNKRMASYSDDGGQTQPAAYGHRWINYFGYNQLDAVVSELCNNPGSRRAVLAMWDGGFAEYDEETASRREPCGDLGKALLGSVDVPCNTHAYFRIVGSKLDMMVSCRSNDILWGAYGANAVHFSVLQEFIAARLGVPVGVMYQMSFNYHVYLGVLGGPDKARAMQVADSDLYASRKFVPMPMFDEPEQFMVELPNFMDCAGPDYVEGFAWPGFTEPFLASVAVPMRLVWAAHKRGDYAAAEALCGKIAADDWRYASRQWIERKAQAKREAA